MSFSLVAGAVCMVIFSNVGSYETGASISSLNINSTGSKSVTTFLSGVLTKYSDERSNSIVLHKACLVLFNGSSYYVPITKHNYTYSDES